MLDTDKIHQLPDNASTPSVDMNVSASLNNSLKYLTLL